jgi:hypothetical protein
MDRKMIGWVSEDEDEFTKKEITSISNSRDGISDELKNKVNVPRITSDARRKARTPKEN